MTTTTMSSEFITNLSSSVINVTSNISELALNVTTTTILNTTNNTSLAEDTLMNSNLTLNDSTLLGQGFNETDPELDVDWPIHGDEATKTKVYNILLWTPFLVIPTFIILFRLVKYSYKYYKAKKSGQDTSSISGIDPFLELSLTLTNNHERLAQIKKIRKEQEQIRKWKERTLQNRHELISASSSPRRRGGQTTSSKTANTGYTTLSEEQSSANIQDEQVDRTALDFLHDLQRKTSKTWTKKLSPEAVRRLFSATRFGRMWMIFQVTCTVVAIINYILLTYQIGREDKKFVKRLDVGLAAVFLMDYLVSFYTAEDRLRFYFNPSSLIDLLSIIPPFVYVFVPETSRYVWFLGLLRILRASRVLRTYRLISFQENEETRELTILGLSFINFLFLSASVINAFETLQDARKDPPTLQTWHDSLYYIMVTFSTIGFGDLTPSTIPSRVVVMCLIILVIIFVPLQTGKLAELYNSTNAYQRAKFTPSAIHAHIILTGAITASSIIDFCREYFSNDPTGHIIILSTDVPTLEVKKLLRHPYYKHRVHYLCGSPLLISDLRRAGAEQATGIFLLNTDAHSASVSSMEQEELQVMRGADAHLLMQSLVIKTTNPGLPVFVQVQDIRSQDLSSNCGANRTLCIDETKMTLMAKNCIVPGLLTLVMNLVHTYPTTSDMDIQESWKREYQDGAANQIFSFKFPPGFMNKTFQEAAIALYNAFGVTLLGLSRNQERLTMNPGKNYVIGQDDVALCMCSHGDDMALRICIQFADTQGVTSELPPMSMATENSLGYSSSPIITPVMAVGPAALGMFKSTNVPSSPNKITTPLLSSPTSIDKKKSTNTLGVLEQQILKSGESSEFPETPISQTVESSSFVTKTVKTGEEENKNDDDKDQQLEETYVHDQDHIIICGSITGRGVRHFIRTIRKDKNKADIPITVLLETMPDISDGIWKDIISFPRIKLVKGTPLKKTTLIQVGIKKCMIVVIFSSLNKEQEESMNLPDANSIFIVQIIKEEWPKTKFVVELVNGTNTKFLGMRDQLSDMSNVRMEAIVSNYSLSISDRIQLYKKARSTDYDRFGIFSRIKKFISPTKQRLAIFGGGGGAGSAMNPGRISVTTNGRDRSNGGDEDGSGKYSSLGEENVVGGEDEVPLTTAFITKLEQEAELNESGLSAFPTYHFDRHFAAGMVSTSSFIHSLICQSYFRPYILQLVKMLVHRVELIPVEPAFREKKYGEVMFILLSRNIVPVGLYRKGKLWANLTENGQENSGGIRSSSYDLNVAPKFPYVYTNCKALDVVHGDDCLFVIRMEEETGH